jgi:hypothetical protein
MTMELTVSMVQMQVILQMSLCLILLYVQIDFGPFKLFWTIQIVLDGCKLFWWGLNCFGQVQIILVRFKIDFSGLIFIIWTCPKWFGPDQKKWTHPKWLVLDQNNLNGPKSFWTHRRTRSITKYTVLSGVEVLT